MLLHFFSFEAPDELVGTHGEIVGGPQALALVPDEFEAEVEFVLEPE